MTDDSEQAALLRAVHDEHSQPLLRYVLRLTRGDMPFAEDVVQESLLRLWRKPEVLGQPTENVRKWLYTVARNLVIDDRRSARYTRELQSEYMPEQPTPRGGLTAELAVTEKKWGTELNWACQYTKDWSRNVASYDIVVTTHDGAQKTVGSWKPAGDEATGLSAATSIATKQIRKVDIRVSGSNEPLAITTLR